MHPYLMQQLAADHVAELRADAQRTRHRQAHPTRRATEVSLALARREWRVLVRALFAR
jgi:hypothetical protein